MNERVNKKRKFLNPLSILYPAAKEMRKKVVTFKLIEINYVKCKKYMLHVKLNV